MIATWAMSTPLRKPTPKNVRMSSGVKTTRVTVVAAESTRVERTNQAKACRRSGADPDAATAGSATVPIAVPIIVRGADSVTATE